MCGCNVVVKAKSLIVLPRSVPSFSSPRWPQLTTYIFSQSWGTIVRLAGTGRRPDSASYFPMILDSNQAFRPPTVRDERRAAQLSSKKETFNCLKQFVICRDRETQRERERWKSQEEWWFSNMTFRLNPNKYLHFLSSSVLSVSQSSYLKNDKQTML